MDEASIMPRGVRVVYRGDDERYSARVASFDGVKTLLGEYSSADEAGAAWDAEMRQRFPVSAISPLLNEVPAATRSPGAGEENGGELLEALLGNEAWHDVVLCGTAPGGLCHPLFCYREPVRLFLEQRSCTHERTLLPACSRSGCLRWQAWQLS